ncbi:MAG TPA: hypothetical protein VJT31_19995 [Rugosimonospora sp.]|nr:hypothetical protein [Rugosimonospora sp.]
MGDHRFADLVSYLGSEDAATGLLRCAEAGGFTPRVPSRRWRASEGYSGATLVTLIIEYERTAEQVILKYMPGPRAPGRGYDEAVAECPDAFRPHLVPPARVAGETASGGLLTFARLAADDLAGSQPLSALPPEQLPAAAALIVDRLLRLWNPGPPAAPAATTVQAFLQAEIGPDLACSGGRLGAWARGAALDPDDHPWLTFPGDPQVCPHPLALAQPGGVLAGVPVDVLIGRSHQDLHLLNVLVPGLPGGSWEVARFQLIDLDGYSPRGVLTRDPAFLLLSGIVRLLPGLDPLQWDRLARLLLGVPDPGPAGLAGDLAEAVVATTARAVAATGAGWSGQPWRSQLRLSLLALATQFTTFDNLGAKARWWLFRLAARLGRGILLEYGIPLVEAGHLVSTNPFQPGPPHRPVVATTPARYWPVYRWVARAWVAGPGDEPGVEDLLREAGREVVSARGSARIAGPDFAGPTEPAVAWACQLQRDLVADAGRLLGQDHPETLQLWHDLGRRQAEAGYFAAAIATYQDVAGRRGKVLGRNHPHTKASLAASRERWLNHYAAGL